MTIDWPAAWRRLRAQRDHWTRRLQRIELVARDGTRVDWQQFPEWRAYIQGKADAYDEAIELVEGCEVEGSVFLDSAVIILARNGLEVEAIANRCGVSVRDVAESLARYAEAAAYIDEQEGGDE